MEYTLKEVQREDSIFKV